MQQIANEKIDLESSREGLDADMLHHVANLLEIHMDTEMGEHKVNVKYGFITLIKPFTILACQIKELNEYANTYGFKINSISTSDYIDNDKPDHTWLSILITAKTQVQLDREEKNKGV